MGASSRAPAELSREELEEEVTRIGELEERVAALEALVGMLGDTSPEDAVLTDVTLAGSPAGVMIEKNTERLKELQSDIEENGENAQLSGDRGQMLPIQRMWGDLKTGAGHSLGDTQKRAARLFGEFVERVVDGEATKVDASGQMYTLTSGAAEEVLLGKHDDDAENLLDGVKKASRSQVIARAMRDVARLSKFDTCECEEIDDCQHTEIRFRSGRPNVLGAPKQSFHAVMKTVYNEGPESPEGEGDNSEESSGEGSEHSPGVSR